MGLPLFALLIILLSAVVVMFDKSLFYMPIVTTLFFLVYYFVLHWPILVKNIQSMYLCQLSSAGSPGVGPTSQTLYDNYMEPLHNSTVNDNRFITTATNVSPGSRIRQSENIRDLYAAEPPVVVIPEIDTDSTRHLNIDRNVGGFKISDVSDYESALNRMRSDRNGSFYDDTNIQRDYMRLNANSKVSFKNQSERMMPSHKWFKL